MGLRSRRHHEQLYWPGFVDAMATLLLVIVFLLSIFVLSQIFLSQQISGKDTILSQLRSQISELTLSLALEKSHQEEMNAELDYLMATLAQSQSENKNLSALLSAYDNEDEVAAYQFKIQGLEKKISQQESLSDQARQEVNLLNQQIAALRAQLVAIEQALEASEAREKQSQTKITNLGQRLNAALVAQVEELRHYRSDFFGLLRDLLKGREDIRIEGDRFVFQSELLFPVGSDEISMQGLVEIKKLSTAILEISERIPETLNWVIRIDGHTDITPINTERFPSNWELSAARAIAVARALSEDGVPEKRLLPAGFGEYQPLDLGTDEKALSRNRRIEFKLTER